MCPTEPFAGVFTAEMRYLKGKQRATRLMSMSIVMIMMIMMIIRVS